MEIITGINSAIQTTFFLMAPYLLLGMLLAGMLHVLVSRSFVFNHLGKKGLWSVVKATLFGVPLPLCSCGVLPLAMSFRKSGASKGATTAFLISTPQTGIDSILATCGMLGLPFAIFRPIAAFVIGIVGGVIADVFSDAEEPHDVHNNDASSGCALCPATRLHKHSLIEKITGMLRYSLRDFPDDITLHLIIGIIIAGLISYFIPNDLFTRYLHNDFLSMLVMIVIGAPLYICATASIPIAAALMLKGASAGAAFVFLTVGPATNAAAIILIAHALGKKIAGLYLLTIIIMSIIAGYILNFIFSITKYSFPRAAYHHHHMESIGFWTLSIGLFFLAVLMLSLYRTHLKPMILRIKNKLTMRDRANFTSYRLTINGMSCRKCSEKIRTAVLSVAGVSAVKIDLAAKTATVQGSADIAGVREAIVRAGYGVDETGAEEGIG